MRYNVQHKMCIATTVGRISWIDYAKAFAIFGILILHSPIPYPAQCVLNAFDLALFFMLSGLVFSIKKYHSFISFVSNKIQTLIVPGLILSVIPFLIGRIYNEIIGDSWNVKQYLIWFSGYIFNLRGRDGFGEIPWFLPCLFVVEIGGYILFKLIDFANVLKRNDSASLLIVASVSILLGWFYATYIHIVLPWSGDAALSMFGFFLIGVVGKRYINDLLNFLNPLAVVPLFAVSVSATLIRVCLR